jgi:Polyketide cyclase / dehydrase and lipid transport
MLSWRCAETIEIAADADQIWRIWSDVANWPRWDGELEWAKLNGPFEAGVVGAMKPKSPLF